MRSNHPWSSAKPNGLSHDTILKAETIVPWNFDALASLEKYYQALLQEEIFFKQKARIKWLVEGDSNTKFFHQSSPHKRAKSTVDSIITEEGITVPTPNDINKVAVEHFSKQLVSEPKQLVSEPISSGNNILKYIPLPETKEDNQILIAPPSFEEHKEATFAIPLDSAPSPNGFTSSFYTFCSDIIKDDLMNTALEFFIGGNLTHAYTSSILSHS